jgi:anaerobic selenocysteine-containing dehydrogenase
LPDSATSSRYAHSVCPHDCPSTCALEVELLDKFRIGSVRGAEENSYTAGVICAKVQRYAERVHHPDRIREPLRRIGAKGSGQFEPISWDQALDEVAEQFQRRSARLGSETVWPYYYAGTMGLVQRDGINRFRHALKYSRQHSTICTTLVDSGWNAGVGAKMGPDPREMAEADLLILWGTNAVSTQVNVMTHVTRARKSRGAQLVVVDPYRNGTAAVADRHVQLRPGSDAALACAMMHVLFKEGFADRDYMAKYADCPEALEAHLESRTPKWAAEITGLDAAEIIEFARLYGRTERAFIRVGYGFSRSRNGASNVHAVTCLPTVTGKWRHKGAGAFYSNSAIYHWDKTLIEGLDLLDPSIRIMDMSRIGPVLTGEPSDLGRGPPVTAMLIQSTNPAVVAPESLRVREGFLREDLFVCVHEHFMTATAALADIVLPATTFLEHDDIYQGGGHSHIQIGRKLIEPYALSRSNHEVVSALAGRLGADHPGFSMSAWDMIDATLAASGWPDAETIWRARWLDVQPPFEQAHFLHGFKTQDKRFHFAPDWAALGPLGHLLPKLPDHFAAVDAARADCPFRLVAAPARSYLNTTFTETPGSKKREVRPTVLMHPDDLARLGLSDGQRARIGNARGAITLHAKQFAGLQPGVVVVESIWPNEAFPEGIGINALVSADPGPPNGGAVFHDTAVWVRAA